MNTRERILNGLDAWVRQRPGLEFGNYGELKSYRAELRQIAKDKRDAETLLRAVALRPSITAENLVAATRAYSGRLKIHACEHGESAQAMCGKNRKHVWCEKCDPAPSALCHWCHGRGYSDAKPGKVTIDYCTGQYWPTEYRKAVCAVLAQALWDARREDLKATYADGSTHYPGEYIRAHFKREFGRSIAQRWFS